MSGGGPRARGAPPAAAAPPAPADEISPALAAHVARLVDQKLADEGAALAAERARLARVARQSALELFLAERPNRKWRGRFADTRDFVRTYFTVLVQMLRAGHDRGRLSPYYMAIYLDGDAVRRHPLARSGESSLRYRMENVEKDWDAWPDVADGTLWARLRDLAADYVEAFPAG